MAKLERKYNVLTLTLLAYCVRPCRQRTVADHERPALVRPLNGTFFSDGDGLHERMVKTIRLLPPTRLVDVFWVRPEKAPKGPHSTGGRGKCHGAISTLTWPQMRTTSRFGWARRTAFRSGKLSLDNGQLLRRLSTALNSAFISMERRWAVRSCTRTVSPVLQMAPAKTSPPGMSPVSSDDFREASLPEAQHFGRQIAHFTYCATHSPARR